MAAPASPPRPRCYRGHQRQRGLRLPRRLARGGCAARWRRPPPRVSWWAPRSPTRTWSASAAGGWTCRPTTSAPTCSSRSGRSTPCAERRAPGSPTSRRTARSTRGGRGRRAGAALVAAVAAYRRGLPLVTLAHGQAARGGAPGRVPVVAEAYADRAYTAEGGLCPRGGPGAVLTDGARSRNGLCGWSAPGPSPPSTALPRRRTGDAVPARRHPRRGRHLRGRSAPPSSGRGSAWRPSCRPRVRHAEAGSTARAGGAGRGGGGEEAPCRSSATASTPFWSRWIPPTRPPPSTPCTR